LVLLKTEYIRALYVPMVPWTRTSTGQCSFAVYGTRQQSCVDRPRTWNQLPPAIRLSELSLSAFKRQLKNHIGGNQANYRSTQPCIPLGSLNRVPALIDWDKRGNVTSAGWQVTLCDPIWHVSSRSGAVLVAQTAIRFLTLPYIGSSSSIRIALQLCFRDYM